MLATQGEDDVELEEIDADDVAPTTSVQSQPLPQDDVLTVFVYGDGGNGGDGDDGGGGAADEDGGGAGGGRRNIQHGGAGKDNIVKIIKVNKMIPEIQEIFLSFKPANKILTDDFLTALEKINDGSTISINEQAKMTVEINKIAGKKIETWMDEKVLLIKNTDNQPFDDLLGKKAVHKATIYRLIQELLDTLSSTPLSRTEAATRKNAPKPSDLYNELWKFMEYEAGSIAVLRTVFGAKSIQDKAELNKLIDGGDMALADRRINLTWIKRKKNTLFDELFIKILSQCHKYEKTSSIAKPNRIMLDNLSNFLKNKTVNKGGQRYRFMLNWVILIAFHLYYTDTLVEPLVNYKKQNHHLKKQQMLIDCCELIKKLHTTFVGWMQRMDGRALLGFFHKPVVEKPVEQSKKGKSQQEKSQKEKSQKEQSTYEQQVKTLFSTAITTDRTLEPLLFGIQDFLCEVTPWQPSLTRRLPDFSTSSGEASPRSATPIPPSGPQPEIPRPITRNAAAAAPAESRPSSASQGSSKDSTPGAIPNPPISQPLNIRRVRKNAAEGAEAQAGSRPSSPLLSSRVLPPVIVNRDLSAEERVKLGLRLNPEVEPEFNPDFVPELDADDIRDELVKHINERELLLKRIHINNNFGQFTKPDNAKSFMTESLPDSLKKEFDTNKDTIPQLQEKLKAAILKRKQRTMSKKGGSHGGNKRRTRKHQRIVRSHHNTKRKISNISKPRENHKYTRKARPGRVYSSV